MISFAKKKSENVNRYILPNQFYINIQTSYDMATPSAWNELLNILVKETNFSVAQNISDLSLNDISLLISLGEKSLQRLERSNLDETLKLQLKAKDDSMQKIIELMMTKNEERFAVIQAENEKLMSKCQTLEEQSNEKREYMKLQIRSEI